MSRNYVSGLIILTPLPKNFSSELLSPNLAFGMTKSLNYLFL
jgi:hypothetical protein